MFKILKFTFLILLFSIQIHGLPNPSTLKPEVARPAAPLNWSVQDMHILTVKEWNALELDNPSVQAALEKYALTAPFTQSNKEFLKNPYFYINQRLQAIDNLLSSLESSDLSPELQSIQENALRKKAYLEALPPPLTPQCLKPGLLGQTRSVQVRDIFWFEPLDPLHRFGSEIQIYLTEWSASSIPNYFMFLETVENDYILNTFAPFTHYVQYYTSKAEREAHQATFKGTKIYYKDQPVHTPGTLKTATPYIFVLGLDQKLYLNKLKVFKTHHSSMFSGGAVLSAGEMFAKDGRITMLSNLSGHYGPKPLDILPTLKILSRYYPKLNTVKLELLYADLGVIGYFNARSFYDKQGRAIAYKTSSGWSPLHLAIALDHHELAPKLLKKYGHLLTESDYPNAWELAFKTKTLDWPKALLNYGLNPVEAWKLALPKGNPALLDLLLDSMSPEQKEQVLVNDSLLLAAKSGSIALVSRFIKLGMNPKATDAEGNNIMIYAAQGGLKLVQWLIDQGLEELLYTVGPTGQTPIHAAATQKDPLTLQYLVNRGLDLAAVDEQGNHVLLIANSFETIQWILEQEKGKKLVTLGNNQGLTPLHVGTYLPFASLYQKMLDLVDDVDLLDSYRLTPYIYSLLSPLGGSLYKPPQPHSILLLEKGASPLHQKSPDMAAWQYITTLRDIPSFIHLLRHTKIDLVQFLNKVKQTEPEFFNRLPNLQLD